MSKISSKSGVENFTKKIGIFLHETLPFCMYINYSKQHFVLKCLEKFAIFDLFSWAPAVKDFFQNGLFDLKAKRWPFFDFL